METPFTPTHRPVTANIIPQDPKGSISNEAFVDAEVLSVIPEDAPGEPFSRLPKEQVLAANTDPVSRALKPGFGEAVLKGALKMRAPDSNSADLLQGGKDGSARPPTSLSDLYPRS